LRDNGCHGKKMQVNNLMPYFKNFIEDWAGLEISASVYLSFARIKKSPGSLDPS